MLRRALCIWSAVALGVFAGCGGDQGSGGSGGGTSSSSSSTGTGGEQPACGDGTVDAAEACDDGNVVDGDGCAKDCTIEVGYTCSGAPSVCATTCGDGKVAGAEACDDGNVVDGDGCRATCEIETGYACDGEPSACATVCGDGIIAGAEACDDGNTDPSDGCDASCALEVGWTCDGAPTICAAVHGDGLIVGAEECDDGNATDGDGCSSSSTTEPGFTCVDAPSTCTTTCGDSIIAGAETCDDGNATDGDGCSGTACAVEAGFTCDGMPSLCATTCGDGIIAGAEICDDGNAADGDGCNVTCLAVESGFTCVGAPSSCTTTCGVGIIAGAELCDDGNALNADGCDGTCTTIENGWTCVGAPSVCVTTCGDGKVAGLETCDDGNTIAGDGCDASCLTEVGWACPGAPSVCATICGDGKLAGLETCDDGNANPGDGCSPLCAVEPGWTCTGVGLGSCTTTCGDGYPAGAEACDDGNTIAGDGCDPSCQFETGYACSGAPSVCGPVCGDGIKSPGEKCDDGNVNSGDCCSSTCQLEAGCELEPNDSIATANDFASLSVANKIKGLINPSNEADMFLVVVPPGTIGTIVGQTLDGPLGSLCASNKIDSIVAIFNSLGTSIVSDDDSGDGWCSLATASGLVPGDYYVRVTRSSAGPTTFDYTLQVTLTLAICGNGVKETGEQCDDGNAVNGDGCTSLCKIESSPEVEPNNACGATASGPFTLAGGARLMSGTISASGDQDYFAITLSSYTDLRVETFDETGPGNCATGHDTDVQAFNSACVALGPLDDDGSDFGLCSLLSPTLSSQAFMRHLAPGTYYILVKAHNGTSTFSYTVLASAVATCGNGVVEGSEQCDGTPGCGTDCLALPVCGNGQVQSGEACDDGNAVDGDGCSSTCQIEPNFLCTQASPSVCTQPCAAGQTLVQYVSTDIPKTILDNTPAGALSVINVPATGAVQNVFVQLNITHTFTGDVDISLISPMGTTIDVSSNNGSSGDHYTNTIFNDACPTPITSGTPPYSTGCYQPEQAFSTLNGQAANGTWTLKVVDDSAGIAGMLNSWSMALCVQ